MKLFQIKPDLPKRGEIWAHVDHEDTKVVIVRADKRTVKYFFRIDPKGKPKEMSLGGFKSSYRKA